MKAFLDLLYARSTHFTDACLTLTAIHPAGARKTPSRHILLSDKTLLSDALDRLAAANEQGWGAFFAVGLRKPGLTRYRRGGIDAVLALPALFVDVDDPAEMTCMRLQALSPSPSCVVFTGGGYHAYWWLEEPLFDMGRARVILHQLAQVVGGDSLSPAQSLRLPNSINSKPQRVGVRCRIVTMNPTRYPLSAFPLPQAPPRPPPLRRISYSTVSGDRSLNPDLLAVIGQTFSARGYRRSGDWLSGPCPYPDHHQHADQHPSFGFNIRTGYGNCFLCGSFSLKDLCPALGIRPMDYGGIYRKGVMPFSKPLVLSRFD